MTLGQTVRTVRASAYRFGMTAAEFLEIDRKRAETLAGFVSAAQRADVGRIMREYQVPAAADLARSIGKMSLPNKEVFRMAQRHHVQVARTVHAPYIELGQRLVRQHEEVQRALGGSVLAELEKLTRMLPPSFAERFAMQRYAPVAEIMRDTIDFAARMPMAKPVPAAASEAPAKPDGGISTAALVIQFGLYLALLQAVLIAVEDAAGEIPASIEHAIRILAAAAALVGETLRRRG